MRGQQVELSPLTGDIYVYATFEAHAENPVPYAGGQNEPKQQEQGEAGFVMPESYPLPAGDKPAGQPRGRQFLTLGERTDADFRPAVRFGIHDGRSLPREPGVMYTYLYDGRLEYYGLWVRPNTPYDFKLKVNLTAHRMTVWTSARGDDRWYLAAENAPLVRPVTSINEVRAAQYPDAPGISTVVVCGQPWPPGEQVRPHPLAKVDRVVETGEGFRFQPMRSTWGIPGRHTTVCRKQGQHFAFADVALSRSGALLCVFSNGSHTGGHGGGSICISRDGGRTWSEPASTAGAGRIQVLASGVPIAECIVAGEKGWLSSADDGKTWTKLFDLSQVLTGEERGCMSHIAELPDGSWTIEASLCPEGNRPWTVTKGEQLEFFRSNDQGKTWRFVSSLQLFPPHSVCEASVLPLPDGRLVVYGREDRCDGYPAIKAFSSDGGETWQVQDLPFPMTGRVCAKFLRDGRVMCTSRSIVGRSALWAWIGDVNDETPFLACGAHFNDSRSIALKGDALHIDNDGACGQLTRYFLRQPDSPATRIDLEVEVKVVANSGRAATLAVPFVGNFRVYPGYIELAHAPSIRAEVTPGAYHVYRVVRDSSTAELYTDGQLRLKTDKGDEALYGHQTPWTPARVSSYPLAFGNEPGGHGQFSLTNLLPRHLPADTTGYSLWRSAKVELDDRVGGKFVSSWSAKRDGFPDQYQLDHIIEVDATAAGSDQGYSGWVELDDGRILVVNYTDDGAPSVTGGSYGIPWIRATWLEHADLRPGRAESRHGCGAVER